MDPGSHALPSRPRFSWDILSMPWTDGSGNQEGFAHDVKLWETFLDKLPDNNSNRITADLRVICLKSQLFRRVLDPIKSIADDTIASDQGVAAIVDALYERDALSVVNEVYAYFTDLLPLHRRLKESFKNYEAIFSAQVSQLSAHGTAVSLHESMLVMMLLAGSSIDKSQRTPMFSAAGGRQNITSEQSSDTILSQIKYDYVASVLCQCDTGALSSTDQAARNQGTVSANNVTISSVTTSRNNRFARGRNRSARASSYLRKQRMSPEELRAFKLKCTCMACHMRGHWASDHNDDGTIKDNLPSLPPADNARGTSASLRKTLHNQTRSQEQPQPSTKGSRNNVLPFTASLSACSAAKNTSCSTPGPIVDDDAPYSAIGLTELLLLARLCSDFHLSFEQKPSVLSEYDWWQSGQGAHASNKRRILGSINITATSDAGCLVRIRHLVIQGSSQWVIGGNVTRASNILHYGGSCLLFPPVNGERDSITMNDDCLHSYMNIFHFPTFSNENRSASFACCSADTSRFKHSSRSWSDVQRMINKVHRDTCGHASYTDMRTLLQRNDMWSDDAQRYLSRVVENCNHFVAASVPPPSHKVALGVLNSSFKDVVIFDHFYLEQARIYHAMDSYSRFPAAYIVPDATLDSASITFESIWVSQSWAPESVQGDQAFRGREFQQYL